MSKTKLLLIHMNGTVPETKEIESLIITIKLILISLQQNVTKVAEIIVVTVVSIMHSIEISASNCGFLFSSPHYIFLCSQNKSKTCLVEMQR